MASLGSPQDAREFERDIATGERLCGLAKDAENDPGHLAPVAPILRRPECLGLDGLDPEIGLELQDGRVQIFQV